MRTGYTTLSLFIFFAILVPPSLRAIEAANCPISAACVAQCQSLIHAASTCAAGTVSVYALLQALSFTLQAHMWNIKNGSNMNALQIKVYCISHRIKIHVYAQTLATPHGAATLVYKTKMTFKCDG